MIKLLILISLCSFPLFAMESDQKDPLQTEKFSFDAPAENDLGEAINLWATYYYTPNMKEVSGDVPLRNMTGDQLGPILTRKEWCTIALEGSVRLIKDDGVKTFNYAGETSDFKVNCSDFFKFKVDKTKFKVATGVWGDGLPDLYILTPFRTIATDNSSIKPGTVLFIPKARGAKIKLPNGKEIIHDGYFFAGDKGGAIKGNHIDVFIGTDQDAPYFPWVKSRSSGTFTAYIVKDPIIISELTARHSVN